MNENMKKVIEALEQAEKLQFAFEIAKEAENEDMMQTIREKWTALNEEMKAYGSEFANIYHLMENARLVGNELLDLNDPFQYRDPAALIETFRKYGITQFTFSSGWSSAAEASWGFIQAGCELKGMQEIHGSTRHWGSDKYEMIPAYVFEVK